MTKAFVCMILILSTLLSCKKNEAVEPEIGLGYYPYKEGFYRIYRVDSIVFNDFTLSTDTFKYYLKETHTERYAIENESRLKVIEEKKVQLSDNHWKPTISWSVQKDNFSVEEQKNNLKKVVLVFPIEEGISWDSNVRNALDREEFTATSKQTETVNEKVYQDVLTVEHFYDTDPLQLNTEIKEVKYAANIGLIYAYEKRVKRFTTGEENDVPIDSGYVLTKQIATYGQN